MSESPQDTPPPNLEPTVLKADPRLSLSPTAVSGDLVGLKLGEYDVLAELGKGGMGIVYRGVQAQIGKTVAIKVLKPEVAAGHDSVPALLAEARAVNSIRHPAIVDIFSFGTTPDGRAYVVMELLEGASLAERLSEVGRLSAIEAIDLLDQILGALEAAHAAGVIHRDLKPANIHVQAVKGGGVRVKLLDFGLAKLTEPGGEAAQKHGDTCWPAMLSVPPRGAASAAVPQVDVMADRCNRPALN